jgi:hypothetical protein
MVGKVCCAGGSTKSLAEQTGEGRDVMAKLLKVGLDLLAVHYGMMMGGGEGRSVISVFVSESSTCRFLSL